MKLLLSQFHRVDSYPKLCIQLANLDDVILIDPLKKINLEILGELLIKKFSKYFMQLLKI